MQTSEKKKLGTKKNFHSDVRNGLLGIFYTISSATKKQTKKKSSFDYLTFTS